MSSSSFRWRPSSISRATSSERMSSRGSCRRSSASSQELAHHLGHHGQGTGVLLGVGPVRVHGVEHLGVVGPALTGQADHLHGEEAGTGLVKSVTMSMLAVGDLLVQQPGGALLGERAVLGHGRRQHEGVQQPAQRDVGRALGLGDLRRRHAGHAGDAHDPDVLDPVGRVLLVLGGERGAVAGDRHHFVVAAHRPEPAVLGVVGHRAAGAHLRPLLVPVLGELVGELVEVDLGRPCRRLRRSWVTLTVFPRCSGQRARGRPPRPAPAPVRRTRRFPPRSPRPGRCRTAPSCRVAPALRPKPTIGGLGAEAHAVGQGDLGRRLAGRLPGPVEVGAGVAGPAGGDQGVDGPAAAVGQGRRARRGRGAGRPGPGHARPRSRRRGRRGRGRPARPR